MLKNNKRIPRTNIVNTTLNLTISPHFLIYVSFFTCLEFLFFNTSSIKQSKNLTKRRFFIKWFLRSEKKKRRLVLRQFFMSKRLRKRKFIKAMKKFKFKQRLLKVKRLVSRRNTFLTSYKNTNSFFKLFLTSFSLKFVLLYSLVLSSKFRRYVSSSILLFKNNFKFQISTYFQNYISQYNN